MLQLEHISKAYGISLILEDVSLVVNEGERLGLVGPNGVGKSTLLKIIVGQLQPDSGRVRVPSDLTVGYLPQNVDGHDGQTVSALIDAAVADLRDLERQMRDLEAQMATRQGDVDALMAAYGAVVERFEARDGYAVEHRIDTVLAGLKVGHIERDRAITTLSGGERARLSLALLLLSAPNILLLDEPTNHLDVDCLDWLERYLSAYRGAMLVVSHDREFLNRTVTGIVEIQEHSGEIKCYAGDYDAYLTARQQVRARWVEDYERQQAEIKALRHMVKVKARQVAHHPDAKTGDKYLDYHRQTVVQRAESRRISSAEERLRRIEADPVPEPPEDMAFKAAFDPQALRGHFPLQAAGLAKRYAGRIILEDVSLALDARARVALVGPNGAGKSTLLRLLAGVEAPDAGTVTVNPQVKIGYLAQQPEAYDPGLTVLEAYSIGLPGAPQQHITRLISDGLFHYEELQRHLGDLSSGQHRKLQIARLIGLGCNCLLLDEPTNFISFDVLEAFEAALAGFPGPVLAVSHDRRFLRNFGGTVWALMDGQLVAQPEGAERV